MSIIANRQDTEEVIEEDEDDIEDVDGAAKKKKAASIYCRIRVQAVLRHSWAVDSRC